MREWPDGSPRLQLEIRDCEHRGDELTHALIRHLQTASFTPFDTRDSHRLVSRLDDVVDLADEAADYMGLFRVEAPTDSGIELSRILNTAAHELDAALQALGDRRTLHKHTAAIDRLEDEGDRAERAALTSLFEGGVDPMVVIRWKDIYARLEAGIDVCEQVAHRLEGLATRRV